MKKNVLTTLLVAVCLFVGTLAGCGSKGDASVDVSNLSAAAASMAIYKNEIKNGASVQDALAKVQEYVPVGTMVMENPEWVQGFDTTLTGYTNATCLAPMMMGQPYIMYVFESADTNALKTEVDSHADLRWNICTMADEKLVEIVDGKVVIVMAPTSFDD